MSNIYEPPSSDLEKKSELSEEERKVVEDTEALKRLLKEQRVVTTPINALFVTAFVIILMLTVEGHAPVLVFVLPAFVSGAIIKYVGRLIDIKHRIISSLIVAVVVYVALNLISFKAVWTVVLSSLNFLVCLALSRRPLTFDEEKLLFRYSIGKIAR